MHEIGGGSSTTSHYNFKDFYKFSARKLFVTNLRNRKLLVTRLLNTPVKYSEKGRN